MLFIITRFLRIDNCFNPFTDHRLATNKIQIFSAKMVNKKCRKLKKYIFWFTRKIKNCNLLKNNISVDQKKFFFFFFTNSKLRQADSIPRADLVKPEFYFRPYRQIFLNKFWLDMLGLPYFVRLNKNCTLNIPINVPGRLKTKILHMEVHIIMYIVPN